MMNITQLPFPAIGQTTDLTLDQSLYLDQWIIPSGITIRLYTSSNFGYVVLPEYINDSQGRLIPKRMFRY